jgi:hypothetical protein
MPFSVIMPAKCVSSVSPRFHYRRIAFCFLPLAAILEFSADNFLNVGLSNLISKVISQVMLMLMYTRLTVFKYEMKIFSFSNLVCLRIEWNSLK